MPEELIKTCALFYFLITLDDKIATQATAKTINLYKQKKNLHSKKNQIADDKSSLLFETETLIKLCLQEWQKIRIYFKKEQIQIINTKSLRWPEHIDLNPWKEFQKNSSENELIAVTLVHVLGISESLLARCLNLSEGTIRYRVGNGLALLGQLNRPNISTLQFS